MKERIVLDTNCLILSLPPKSRYHKTWEAIIRGQYVLCVSNEILEEYEEIISRFWGKDIADYVMNIIINNTTTYFMDPFFKYKLIDADPDDNKFVDCAITSNARYIVTEDRHFDVLRQIDFPKVDVIGIDEFLHEVENA
uniref:PIN domain-containing protein n=4 Tax=unclassified Prevotella TaxID=2638335 RepID=A0AB33JNK0_9BACT